MLGSAHWAVNPGSRLCQIKSTLHRWGIIRCRSPSRGSNTVRLPSGVFTWSNQEPNGVSIPFAGDQNCAAVYCGTTKIKLYSRLLRRRLYSSVSVKLERRFWCRNTLAKHVNSNSDWKTEYGILEERYELYACIGLRIVAYSQLAYHIKVKLRLYEEFHVFEYNRD